MNLKSKTMVTLAMLATASIGLSNTAFAAGPPKGSTGVGWALKYNTKGAWNLKHNFTYTVKFVNTDSRTKSTPYLKNTVAYLNAMPEMKKAKTKFVLSSTVVGTTHYNTKNWCGNGYGTIVFVLKYRPFQGKKNYSMAHPCYHLANNSAFGGYVEMNSEYWLTKNKTTAWTYAVRNIHAHELGHMLGLGHPDARYFSKNEATPIMHVPTGGYKSSNAGKYPAADTRGIRRLISNGS